MGKFAIEIVEPRVIDTNPLPQQWPNLLQTVELCGRMAHKSEKAITPISADRFVRKVAVRLGHESILEHAQISAMVICSRACSHQIVRHRLAAYTQESMRYCDYSKGDVPTLQVVCPPSIWADHVRCANTRVVIDTESDDFTYGSDACMTAAYMSDPKLKVFIKSCARSYGHYLWLREQGVKAEDARSVLNHATKTEIWMTYNLRSWLHFFKMRCDSHAQWEIRKIANQMQDLFKEHLPAIIG